MDFGKGDSLTSHNFGIQIDGVMIAYLSRVSGISIQQDTIEHKSNSADGQPTVAVLPGTQKNGQCTVERGMTISDDFTKWQNASINGQMGEARKNASIIMMDTEGTPVKRWNLRNAWCSEVQVSDLQAGEAGTATETVTIVFEEMVVE